MKDLTINSASRNSGRRIEFAQGNRLGAMYGLLPETQVAVPIRNVCWFTCASLVRGEFSPGAATVVNYPAGLAGPSKGGNRIIRCASTEPGNYRPDECRGRKLFKLSAREHGHAPWHRHNKVACGGLRRRL